MEKSPDRKEESRGARRPGPPRAALGRDEAEEASAGGPARGGSPGEPLSFEDAFRVAETAVEALERGQLTLEESLERYEDGLRALARCYEILRSAERRIEVLGSKLGAVEEGTEGPVWVPAADSASLKDALRAAEPNPDAEARGGPLADGPEKGQRPEAGR